MSSCLSGGGRTYGFDLEIVKSPSTSTRTSQTSSPSSTLSEASNSPLAISTRKPRTPRKRPNQTYNEAAALLSTAYPNIFSAKHLTKNSRKFTKPHDSFFDDSPELLLPFRAIDDSVFLLHPPVQGKSSSLAEPKVASFGQKACQSSSGEMEIDSTVNSMGLSDGYQDDFDAESILDEEVEEGIDSIMGNLSVDKDATDGSNAACHGAQICRHNSWYGNPIGISFGGKFEFGFGMRRALRHVEDGNWWCFPIVDVLQISPKFNTTTTSGTTNKSTGNSKKLAGAVKKKKKVTEKPVTESKKLESAKENSNAKPNAGLLLKLNYDEILNAWSGRASPFSDDVTGSDAAGNDVSARLAQIDLFAEGGGLREASVLRYKEKRRTRLFSKKIRYQVRKVNADRRPRMKGRFVRRPNSNASSQR